jgi:fumarate reductase subunit D
VQRATRSKLGSITKRRILYGLAAMVVVFVVGLIIGLIWADTSDLAGVIAGITNVVAGAAILVLLIALAVVSRRERMAA